MQECCTSGLGKACFSMEYDAFPACFHASWLIDAMDLDLARLLDFSLFF